MVFHTDAGVIQLFDKKSLLVASQLAQKSLLRCKVNTEVSVAAQLIKARKTSSILVEDKGQIVGIWTEADCTKLRFDECNYYNSPIENFMSTPVITVNETMPLQEIIMAFHRHRVRHLLVVNDEKETLGIVSQSDVIRRQGIERYLQLRQIKDNYNPRIPVISGDELISAVVRTMADYNSSSAIVKNSECGQYGIITERNLLKILADRGNDKVAWHYAAQPLVTISEEDSLYQAYLSIQKHGVRHLVVQDKAENLLGVLSLQHILSDIEIAYFQKLESILTERDNALKESRKNLHFAEKIIEASLDSIMVTNRDGFILSVNSAFTSLTGYSEVEAIGQSSSLLSSGMHGAEFYQNMWQSITRKGSWQGEIWNKKKSGEVYPEWLTIVKISEKTDGEPLYAAIFSDITERKRNEKRIHALAFFDELTGLPNRRLFNDRFEIALSTAHRNKQLAVVLFLDLDRFKQINDSLGHNVGDELLIAAAGRIKRAIKEGDTVSRFGGDEFVILLTEMDSVKDIVGVIERLTHVLNEPYEFKSMELQVTSSIGAAVYPHDGEDADTLLKHADTAMYKAKDSGRNSYQLFAPEMNAVTMGRLITQNYLRTALTKNEFELFYQMQFDKVQNKVTGIEALIRWNHPELGRVSPAQFIPMAEELGIIVDIDRWVLAQATKQRQLWYQEGLDCGRIAVNISTRHFRHNLMKSVEQTLNESGLSPALLELEVTEGCFIDNIEHASAMLNQIRQLGVINAIDDFGTGFSALSYLTNLPLDVLKIDAGFISKLPGDKQQCQIVSTIIAMAKGLNLNLVAEGVETIEQANYLLDNHCDVMQGYLYSVPVNAEQTTTKLRAIQRQKQPQVN